MNPDVSAYLAAVPEKRRVRLDRLARVFQEAVPKAKLTMRYKMPTFELDDNWVALGNQKQYIAVYFCSHDLIANVVARHPELNTGVGCVRIRDTQDVPDKELLASFRKAMKK